jgi:predicted secreted protein
VDDALKADPEGRFAVELEEPAAAGYRWLPVALPPGITLEGEEVTPGGDALGGVRKHVFRFAGTEAGRHRIDFELKRPWEEKAADSRRVQVQVGA